MTDPIHFGIVGTSWYADLVHLPLLTSHPGAKVAAICGRNRERADEMAQKYGIPAVFTDYKAMIEQAGLQALVVATPDDTHYPMVMYALRAGLHVICEKPLALTTEQAREMYEAAQEANVKHMVFFTNRWMPQYRYVRQLIDEGYLGRCFHCHICYEGGYGRDGTYGWRFDAARGHGMLGDLGSHAIDLAHWLVGDITRVSAHLASYVDRLGANGKALDAANDSAALIVEFANGAQGTIHVSAVAHVGDQGQSQQVILHGEDGTLEISGSFADVEVRGARADEEQVAILPIPDELRGDVDRTNLFLFQVIEQLQKESLGDRAFIDAIIDDRPIAPTFYDGLKVQEVIDAAVESHRTGRTVALSHEAKPEHDGTNYGVDTLSIDATTAVVLRFAEILNSENWSEQLDEVFVSPMLEDFRRGHGEFRAGFSNYHLTIDDIVATPDKSAHRFTLRATHTGEYLGHPPTGKQIVEGGMNILHIKDGKITAIWEYGEDTDLSS